MYVCTVIKSITYLFIILITVIWLCDRSYLKMQIFQLKGEKKLPLLAQTDVARVLC